MIIRTHKTNTFIGKAIRFFSYGDYNHTSIEIGGFIYEADFKQGVIKHKRKSKTVKVIHEFILSKKKEKEVIDWLDKQVGKKYDWLGVFSFVFHLLKPRCGYWFCSELGYVALIKAIGIEMPEKSQKISPSQLNDVVDILRANKLKVI